jgi:acetyl-CoA C-acetyltransferase
MARLLSSSSGPAGIRDKVAVVGMGCTRFGERFDVGAEELMVEAYRECLGDAGITPEDIDGAWLGTVMEDAHVGKTGIPLATALRLPHIPVTRVENLCVTGTEAFRGAVHAVAAGAHDVCLALGVEKLKDVGYGGLPAWGSNLGALNWLYLPNATAVGAFAQLAVGYRAKYGVSMDELKRAMAQISVKSHDNGALNPRAHLRNPITLEKALSAPMVSDPLGLFDCCGVSDGAAAAIVTTVDRAREMGIEDPVTVKALQVVTSNGEEMGFDGWDFDRILTTEQAATKAYAEAGIVDPAAALDLLELHDCFSITELVTYEDLHLSERGLAWRDVLDGRFDRGGALPAQVDGGLKCFGHPIGASGLRMLYELYLQLRGRAGDRQLDRPRLGLTHNLCGYPYRSVAAVTILGRWKGP